MMPDLSAYSAILSIDKWISKIDFIYRIKSSCDCSDERHQRFLQQLYSLDFRQIRLGQKGEILIQ